MTRWTLVVLLTSAGLLGAPQERAPIAQALMRVTASHAQGESYLPALTEFYDARQYRAVWTGTSGLNAAGRSVLAAFAQADADGLEPEEYALPGAVGEPGRPDDTADLEVHLSLSALRFAHDLGWGLTLPSEVDRANSYEPRAFDAAATMARVASAADPGAELRALAPISPAYRLMREALGRLRKAEAGGGWSRPSDGPTLRRGDRGPRVQELRSLLVERGDLDASAATGEEFDATVAAALVRFQNRHGLAADGVYGPAARRALDVPIAARIQQVVLGLERIRWLPARFTGRRIGVNLADFKVYVLDDQAITFETRAVVGKQYHETPMFSALMTYVVINPYWNVPPSIARAEILPKARQDPDYLTRNHMEVADGVVRQTPGPWNSLGLFKFMFPNVHNVYLHDTPARALFSQVDRAYSHGCVRVEHPAALAAVLLGRQGWTPERIDAAVKEGSQTVVTLDQPIPVHLTYATAFLDTDGLLHYRPDVYGRDAKLVEALEHRRHGAVERGSAAAQSPR